MSPWPLQSQCSDFYGNPDPDGDGVPSRAWEDSNLVSIVPPWKMVLAWDVTKSVKGARIHRKCGESLGRVFASIWQRSGQSQEQIERMRLHLYGGAYNFRLKRGGHTLSMHSYGCAIDLDPEHNGMGRPWSPLAGGMPMLAVTAFEDEGWTFGGRWAHPDAMHFQAARV